MGDIFGGGKSKQKVKSETVLPPHVTAAQQLLTRLLIARLFQNNGVPLQFGEFLQQGPRPMPNIGISPQISRDLGGLPIGVDPRLLSVLGISNFGGQ